MPAKKRFKTRYPGVYYIKGRAIGTGKQERIYYIIYRKNSKVIEEKAGRQYQDGMTPGKAMKIRIECIEGKRLSRKETRDAKKAGKDLGEKHGRKYISGAQQPYSGHSLQQEGLSEPDDKFRDFMETASDFMYITDKQFNFSFVNESMAKHLEYSKNEMIGMNIFQILTQKNVDTKAKKTISDLITKGQISIETIWVTKTGKYIYGEAKGTAIYDSKGNFSEARGVLRNITDRKKAEHALKKREAEIVRKNKSLEEMNAALHVLLEKREADKKELEDKVVINMQQLVVPYLEKLVKTELNITQRSFLTILSSNMKEIVSPFAYQLSSKYFRLTPAEIEISNFIKQGKTTKEIAELLNLSIETIESHRKNIRKKIGIKNKKENLRTHLLSLTYS